MRFSPRKRMVLIFVVAVAFLFCACEGEVEQQETQSEETSSLIQATEALDLHEIEKEILVRINEERTACGLPALEKNTELYDAALRRAKETLETWSHTRPNGSGYETVFAEYGIDVSQNNYGENLATDFLTAEDAVEALMNSQGHRENILRESFSSVAIAVVRKPDGFFCLAQEFWG